MRGDLRRALATARRCSCRASMSACGRSRASRCSSTIGICARRSSIPSSIADSAAGATSSARSALHPDSADPMTGSGRLEHAFESRAAPTGLIPYLTAGYPTAELTLELMRTLESVGALAIEIGIPFSDPIADGPDIQRASERALAGGMSTTGVLELIHRYRERGRLPVIVMTYANPVLRFGLERFTREARDAGVDAVIVSDLPAEESPEVWRALDDAGLDSVLLVAPTTSAERLRSIVSRCRGFVYCLARTGVTGAGEGYGGVIGDRVRDIRQLTSLPVAIGFGISGPEQARALRGVVDAVIVGAAFARDVAADPVAGVVARIQTRARALIDAMA